MVASLPFRRILAAGLSDRIFWRSTGLVAGPVPRPVASTYTIKSACSLDFVPGKSTSQLALNRKGVITVLELYK